MASLDRLERLTDLVLVLLDARRPMTLDAIANEVPGYPTSHDARRQAFERDKRLLRDDGIPVRTEPLDGTEQFGYRIDRDAFYLPDLDLTPDEQASLHLAVAGVHLGDPSGRDALLKLGAAGLTHARPIASVVPSPALVVLFDGLRSRAELRFWYRGEERRVAPAGVRFRDGHWYLVGWDRGRAAGRTFRVDRIEGDARAGDPGSGEPPEAFDPQRAAPADPWRPGEGEESDAILRVDAIEAARVIDQVGERAVESRGDDGSVTLRLGVSSRDSLRQWVLGLLDHAEVIGPPSLRADIVGWLSAMADPEPMQTAPATAAPVDKGAVSGGDDVGPERARADALPVPPERSGDRLRDASGRLRRLLAIVAWLARVGEAPIADVARRFDMSEDVLVRELELAACCGIPPYSPDALLEIVVTEQSVEAHLAGDMARPRRLTPAEGLALLAAGRTILAVPGADGDGALARALDKLESVLGDHQRLVVDIDDPPLLDTVRRAVDLRRKAQIEYHSASTDETTQRTVDPLRLTSIDGHWYLDAHCNLAHGLRRFRVDRIRRMEVLDAGAAAPEEPSALEAGSFVPGPGAVEVRVFLAPGAAWVADSVPVAEVRSAGGGLEVTLAVGGRAWLERLLLQLGTSARVLAPADLLDAGPQAARRVLARYESV